MTAFVAARGVAAVACAACSAAPGTAPSDAGAADIADVLPEAAGGHEGGAAKDASTDAPPAHHATARLSTRSIAFGSLVCSAAATPQTVTVTNTGEGLLAVTAMASGAAFTVSPAAAQIKPGENQELTVTAAAPAWLNPGGSITGSIDLFTNDPEQPSAEIALSLSSTGAELTLVGGAAVAFPVTEVGYAALAVPFTLMNAGNASASFALGAPSDSSFTLGEVDGGFPTFTLGPGDSWSGSAGFTPTRLAYVTAASSIKTTGATCGASLAELLLTGQGSVGAVTGWPTAAVDFGSGRCGGSPQPQQSFLLMNAGPVAAHFTMVSWSGDPGFTSNAAVGRAIGPGEGLTIYLDAPGVPSPCPAGPLSATLTLETDADTYAHAIMLTEEVK